MQSLTSLMTDIGETLPDELLQSSLKATVILLLAAIATRLLRRSSSATRHGILAAALISILAVPLVSRGLPRFVVPAATGFFPMANQEHHGQEHNGHAGLLVSPNVEETQPASALVQNGVQGRTPTPSVPSIRNAAKEPTASRFRAQLATVAVVVWALGVLSVLLTTALGEFRTLRLRSLSTKVQDSDWIGSLSEVTRQHDLLRRVKFLETPAVSVPITCGTVSPAVVIPSGLVCSTDERRRILRHEIAHVVRFDVALQTLGRIACAFYWFHPLAWWCLRRMHVEREQACDDWVLRAGDRATDYADQLLSLAKNRAKSRTLAAVGILRSGALEKRLATLMSSDCSHEPMGRRQRGVLAVCAMLISVVVAVVHPQPSGAESPKKPNDASSKTPAASKVQTESDPAKSDSYTAPIDVTGRALDAQGNPIPGAVIYLSAQAVQWDDNRIAETTTDDQGRYTFRNVPLPIGRADTNNGRDNGAFILFGKAKGYGFTWRPKKWYCPNPRPSNISYNDSPDDDLPTRYEEDDKIELDLTFPKASTIRGIVIDGNGKPIAKTKLALWNAEQIPRDGYGPRSTDSDRRPFSSMGRQEFELLNADVPEEMWTCRTNITGHFEFTGVPKDCRFRVKVRPPGFPSRMVWFSTRAGMKENYKEYRLYDASKDIELSFQNLMDVPFEVVYGDSGKPAANVYVGGHSRLASASETTGKDGRVTLALPTGKYNLTTLPAYGTPYLDLDSEFTLNGDEPPSRPIRIELPAAGQVEIHVVDKETGKGMRNVDLWRETEEGDRDLHMVSSWELPRLVRRDRPRTNENGVINTIFAPGRHRIGVAWESYPNGYRPVLHNGKEIECEAGKKMKVVFQLEQRARRGFPVQPGPR